MSIDYIPIWTDRSYAKIKFEDLFDGRLEKYGVNGLPPKNDRMSCPRCLTDGRNYLWVYQDGKQFVACFTCYFPNGVPSKILAAIEEEFGVAIISEYEPEYWGFSTQAEWDAALDALARQVEDEFYADLLRYLRGEPHNIRPFTVGMGWAEKAQKLVAQDAGWIDPERKEAFIAAIRQTDSAACVKLNEKDLAAVRLRMTHGDDSPRA